MSDVMIASLPVARRFAATPVVIAPRNAAARMRAIEAASEPLAVVVVSLMLAGGFLLAWRMLRQFAPQDVSLGWAGIAFQTPAIATAAVAAISAVRALARLCIALRPGATAGDGSTVAPRVTAGGGLGEA